MLRIVRHHPTENAMSQYRRYFIPGATYFFTVVTHDRRPFLTSSLAQVVSSPGHSNGERRNVRLSSSPSSCCPIISTRSGLSHWAIGTTRALAQIKESFTRSFLASGGAEGFRNDSRVRRRERAIWQRRFWEHTCRDEDDLDRCIHHIHWNPVKHGLVERVQDYPWSSFHLYVQLGEYDGNWGDVNPCPEADKWGCE